mgnify:CR=1 FL=1
MGGSTYLTVVDLEDDVASLLELCKTQKGEKQS